LTVPDAAAHVRACGLDPVPVITFFDLILGEDIGSGDVTSAAVFRSGQQGSFKVRAKRDGVLAGGPLAAALLLTHDPDLEISLPTDEGSPLRTGDVLLAVSGSVRSILEGERVALNLLGRLGGIATLTALFVKAVAGSKAKLLDTRKTGLGTRNLDKYAVRCGGGHNHRIGLYDAVLVKDNHIAAAGSISAAVDALARSGWPPSEIEVECDSPAQVRECLACGVGMVLLDNMTPGRMAEMVDLVAGRCELEASGGVTLDNVAAIAASGVDYVSVGALTHSAPALDVSLGADD
jgi:nicotinate-nucleotide pyrophosphorylase (carboxylating)